MLVIAHAPRNAVHNDANFSDCHRNLVQIMNRQISLCELAIELTSTHRKPRRPTQSADQMYFMIRLFAILILATGRAKPNSPLSAWMGMENKVCWQLSATIKRRLSGDATRICNERFFKLHCWRVDSAPVSGLISMTETFSLAHTT